LAGLVVPMPTLSHFLAHLRLFYGRSGSEELLDDFETNDLLEEVGGFMGGWF
jgi:hypothetical protein